MSSAPPGGPLSVVDLFSGAGGMSCGFHLAGGFHHRLAVDAQRRRPSARGGKCNTTFELNFGHAPLDADLATADPEALVQASGLTPGELDVLISCAPCTGFSAKLRRDYDDARNSLVARTALYVAAWRPRVLVMENVPEMLRGAHRHHGEALMQALHDLGYAVRAEIIHLGDYGVPQRRRRTLLVAARDGAPIPWPQPSSDPTPTVWQAIGHLPPLAAGETDPADPHHRAPGLSPAVLARTQVTPPDGGSWKDYAQTHPEHLIPSMRRNADSGSYSDAYGRMHWHRPAPTITRECASPGNGRYLHPEQHRLCSLREMSLLQGFPEDYAWAGDLAGRYNQVGDAVPPRFALQLARSVRCALEAEDRQITVDEAGRMFPRQSAEVATPLSGARKPSLPVTGPHTAKDQAKWNRATKMIARGSVRSSSHRYAQAAGQLANSGHYSAQDTVFISAEGNRSGRLDPDWSEIMRAVQAGARFVTDVRAQRETAYNRIGEGRVAQFLTDQGYRDDGTGLWSRA